ncbi:MAG: hypothetical protein H7A25_04315 [Leptospiraceae bacterium]|nr:hypothetical protein [Leptospiraceae bacterium]MCP5499101.1 hypothetical protein [Leptospiraceae bacterium]
MEKKSQFLELKTPDLGDADKIELIEWYKKEGQLIEEGEEVLELITEKASFPVESPVKGILKEIRVPKGSKVLKGEILGILEIGF